MWSPEMVKIALRSFPQPSVVKSLLYFLGLIWHHITESLIQKWPVLFLINGADERMIEYLGDNEVKVAVTVVEDDAKGGEKH